MLIASTGCRHGARKPLGPTTSSAAANRKFEDGAHGFALTIPDGWQRKPIEDSEDSEDVLELSGPAAAELSVAVPKLPPHVPGFIPLGAVQNGYVQDVRRRMTDVTTSDEPAMKVAGVAARRFTVAGTDKSGAARKMQVLIFARGDTLFIVTGEGPAQQFEPLKSAVDRLAASWNWLKKDTKDWP